MNIIVKNLPVIVNNIIKLNTLFNKPSNISGIMFKCNNCNYSKKIKDTIKLYQMNVDSVYSVYRSIDDNKLLSMNPIYPRTKDYECKNINCITHKLSYQLKFVKV